MSGRHKSSLKIDIIMKNPLTATKPIPPKPLPSVHLLDAGTPRFAGCGGLETVD